MNNNNKLQLQFIETLNNQTCLWSLKTFYDLPSSYKMYYLHKNTNSIIQSLHLSLNPNYNWFPWFIIIPILIVIFTIFGNSLACYVVLNDRHLRHRSNIFFISLSIINIIFSSTVMLFNIIYNLINPNYFSDNLIKLFFSLDQLFCTVTILHLVAMAFDRFIHIKVPLKYSRCFKPKYLLITIISLWFISFLIAFIPIQFNWNIIHYKECLTISNTTTTTSSSSMISTYFTNKNYTTPSIQSLISSSIEDITLIPKQLTCIHKVDRFYAITNAIFSFIIPLIIMIIIYTHLFLLTKQHINRLNIFPSFTNDTNDLATNEQFNNNNNNNKQIIYLLDNSSNFSKKFKKIFKIKKFFFNYHIKNPLTTTSMDTIKISSELCKIKQLNYTSLRFINIKTKNDYLIHMNKTINRSCIMSTNSFTSLDQSMNRRKHSLPLYTISRNSSFNIYNTNNSNSNMNMNDIIRPQLIINYPEKQIYNSHKAAITLGVILGSFTICWLPYFTINCIASFCDYIPKEVIFAATWLGYFNACLNSLVYSLLNNNFRMSCAKLLCAWHYNRERRQQYGLNQLKHFGDTPIQLAIGRVPWNKL
ncbi:unnamed protein product [Schistosoma rodhaini]|uniref:G-protein coupled receptors family 1 profile domain-containing protein n=1 Tax=Schistosoma rodhaini TaxID=6188 RepID=A0AA85FR93_9TREM|nr:unnamed protein product [Schistosoma rodhaini]